MLFGSFGSLFMVKETTTKPAAKAPRKPRATATKKPAEKTEAVSHAPAHHEAKDHAAKGKYIFATGRRKTAIANIRLFSGKHESTVNHKPLSKYFSYSFYLESINKPFDLT